MSIGLDRITKTFGDYPAIRDISLEAEPGEFLALLGPSGSGKTTLLRIMAGLEFPEEGRVSFEGEDITALSIAKRRVGFVFQHYALFKHMTVAANIGFGLSVRKRRDRPSRAAIKARVQELLDLVQLGELGQRYPAQLSGGQRQRVALARALAVEPRLLLLDEPFGALDALVRKELRRWLRELHDRVGLTSIFVTHDQEEALELADRVVVMNQGKIEQIATPHEIYHNPANAFVFAFVGEANCVPVTVTDGRAAYLAHVLDLPLPAGAAGPGKLYFRPHEAELAEGGAPGLPAVIAQIRPRGGGVRVQAAVDGLDVPIELDLVAREGLAPGSPIAIRLLHARLFP
ncbi:MAG: sulfate/molybdate ABC transporter ATP-binding protein [Sphingomonas sp.]|uniref:sulfate/molybdate ABC transporter ATP-binding protein n=1 Tax=Sphingomonas sp. TaxID=28214 RepID=UPI002274ECA7|nr:sulfate/molybdate ABC transporter ATP-binding protein [Sphingomonas sp.]MCX8476322.1 sulfate/molybdate ABC transporter ATP-binding protein [Sphingomonas sp.]